MTHHSRIALALITASWLLASSIGLVIVEPPELAGITIHTPEFSWLPSPVSYYGIVDNFPLINIPQNVGKRQPTWMHVFFRAKGTILFSQVR